MKRASVIGSGPNGLAAAIVLAQAGGHVNVFEAEAEPGGAARTLPLTLPRFLHDFGSAVHPLAAGSPFFTSLPLTDHGLEWIHGEAPLAHPLDDGTAVVLERDLAEPATRWERTASVARSGGTGRADWKEFAEDTWPGAAHSASSAAHGAIRPGRRRVGAVLGAQAFFRDAGAGCLCGAGRALASGARPAVECGRRDRAWGIAARGRLAEPARRSARHSARADRLPRIDGRSGAYSPPH